MEAFEDSGDLAGHFRSKSCRAFPTWFARTEVFRNAENSKPVREAIKTS
jgi:hypothetical protein